MPSHSHHKTAKVEEFSLPLFAFTVLVTLGGLFAILAFGFPHLWAVQLGASFGQVLLGFAAISMVICFLEYFFHRYVLHRPAIPFLRRLYRQHTLHHGLTRIARRHRPDGPSLIVVENKFPIVEVAQGEASFFPWFTLAIFSAVLSPLFVLLQWITPSFPWFLSGFLALASSIILYELLHAINHWPIEKWLPLVESKRWKWFWHPVYSFHLRHHAVIDCNESVSGFFGLPVADWVFGTCVIPKTIYSEGIEWTKSEFTRPRPRWLIHQLDTWASAVVKRRRDALKTDTSDEAKAIEAELEHQAMLQPKTEVSS